MVILGFGEDVSQLAMVNSVYFYGHVLRREGGLVLTTALEFEVEGQRRKKKLK